MVAPTCPSCRGRDYGETESPLLGKVRQAGLFIGPLIAVAGLVGIFVTQSADWPFGAMPFIGLAMPFISIYLVPSIKTECRSCGYSKRR